MKPKTMHRLSLSMWAAAAVTATLREVIPETIQPALKLVIPAAITTSVLAGVASIVAAHDRHTESTNQLSENLDQLLTQVASDQKRLGYLRGLVAAASSGNALPSSTPAHL